MKPNTSNTVVGGGFVSVVEVDIPVVSGEKMLCLVWWRSLKSE